MKDKKFKLKKILFCISLLSIIFITGCGGGGGNGKPSDSELLKKYADGECFELNSKYLTVSGVEPSYYYTGLPIKPLPMLTLSNGNVLTENDYSYYYENNTEVGTAKIVFSKTRLVCAGTIEFNIEYNPADLTSMQDAEISEIHDGYEYTGSPIEPVPVVRINGTILTKDVDYNINYSNNVEPGDAKLEIVGLGKYKDSKLVEFGITHRPNITCLNPVYNGSEQTIATCENGTITQNETGIDVKKYNVKCEGNKESTITYFTSVTDCSINPIDISSDAVVTEVGDSEIPKDRIRVTYKGKVLEYGTEYDFDGSSLKKFDSSSNQVTHYLNIVGRGNYRGSVAYSYSIQKKINLSNAVIEKASSVTCPQSVVCSNGPLTPTSIPKVSINGEVLEPDVDFDYVYSNNTKPGAAKITITGKGQYEGTKTGIAFYIIDASCGKSSKGMETSISLEGKEEKDKFNILSERTSDGKLIIELHKNESIDLIVKVPPLCGEFIERVDDRPKNGSGQDGWRDYLTQEVTEDQVDENGNIIYIWTITAKEKLSSGIIVNQYRAYSTQVSKHGINFSAYAVVKILKDGDKTREKSGQDPVCGEVENASTKYRYPDQTVCVSCSTCIQSKYCKTYDGSRTVKQDYIEIQGTNSTKKQCLVDVYVTNDKNLVSPPTPTPTVDPKTLEPRCDGGENQSKEWREGPQTVCARCPTCQQLLYCKEYDGSKEVKTDTIEIIGKNGQSRNCEVNVYVRKNAEYTCELNYDSKYNKLTIVGNATDGTKIARTMIDGTETISITPTSSRKYSGIVYFANGKQASCSKEIKVESNSRCCCLDGTFCAWTTKECSSIGRYEAPLSKEQCELKGTDKVLCESSYEYTDSSHIRYNIDWSTASSKKVCVICSGCEKIRNCKTFMAGAKDISSGTIPIKGLNGVTKYCEVDVKLRAKASNSREKN